MTLRSIARGAAAVAAIGWLAGASPAQGAGLDQLHAFLAGAKSGKATFRQVVVPAGRPATQESTGTFTFQRPGKFRWAYEKPYEQLIVGDGSKLWIYDRDLNQVIVRTLDTALGSSPATLLAGDNALEKSYTLADAGRADGLEFVDARPNAADSGFRGVRIGLKDNVPRRMELTDAFGNVTTLDFGTFDRNPALDAAQFRFVPPKGADVVGE